MEKDMDNGNARGRDLGVCMDNDPYYGCRCKIQCDGVLRHIDNVGEAYGPESRNRKPCHLEVKVLWKAAHAMRTTVLRT